MALANKVVFDFQGAQGFDAATTGVKFTTPNAFAHKFGVLQAIQYKRATAKVFNQSDATVSVTFKHGAVELATFAMAANASSIQEIDLGGISGAANITMAVEVTTAGTGTGSVFAFIDVEQPLQVSTC